MYMNNSSSRNWPEEEEATAVEATLPEREMQRDGWRANGTESSGGANVTLNGGKSLLGEEGLEEATEPQNDEFGDNVCAICDDGGELLCCDGPCLRSFHALLDPERDCPSIGLKENPKDEFLCDNCLYKQHQCFVCGKLGRSTSEDGEQEVFLCDAALCGKFYHPRCVAEKLVPAFLRKWEREAGKSLLEGDALVRARNHIADNVRMQRFFQCPLHACQGCGQGEGFSAGEEGLSEDVGLKLVPCRRCPRAWHVKCIPESMPVSGADQRVWGVNEVDVEEGLSRFLYCRTHKIRPDTRTPERDHLKWPKAPITPPRPLQRRRLSLPIDELKEEEAEFELMGSSAQKEPVQKKRKKAFQLGKTEGERETIKREVNSEPLKEEIGSQKAEKKTSVLNKRTGSPRTDTEEAREEGWSNFVKEKWGIVNVRRRTEAPMFNKEELMRNIRKVKEYIAGEVSEEKVRKSLAVVSSYSTEEQYQTMKMNKIKSIINAVEKSQTAVENGEMEASAFRPNDAWVKELKKCEVHMRVYLAPFLHGSRYTSYGRHFTQIAKLEEVVNRLLPYVEDGDCLVDMCCGSNDFSRIAKASLEHAGKRRCEFKNFDIFPPADTFNFQKMDWFNVPYDKPHRELPDGDKLIIGLNPPFARASTFAEQAARFRPKLIVLIVPPETRRPSAEYELLWNDSQLLAGKAFYLPGSVDNESSWNHETPPLYLYCRKDLWEKYSRIALPEDHRKPVEFQSGGSRSQPPIIHEEKKEPIAADEREAPFPAVGPNPMGEEGILPSQRPWMEPLVGGGGEGAPTAAEEVQATTKEEQWEGRLGEGSAFNSTVVTAKHRKCRGKKVRAAKGASQHVEVEACIWPPLPPGNPLEDGELQPGYNEVSAPARHQAPIFNTGSNLFHQGVQPPFRPPPFPRDVVHHPQPAPSPLLELTDWVEQRQRQAFSLHGPNLQLPHQVRPPHFNSHIEGPPGMHMHHNRQGPHHAMGNVERWAPGDAMWHPPHNSWSGDPQHHLQAMPPPFPEYGAWWNGGR